MKYIFVQTLLYHKYGANHAPAANIQAYSLDGETTSNVVVENMDYTNAPQEKWERKFYPLDTVERRRIMEVAKGTYDLFLSGVNWTNDPQGKLKGRQWSAHSRLPEDEETQPRTYCYCAD